MDYKYIEQLLERYWNCETSLQEESILRNFFAQSNVPEHLKAYQDVFLCQEKASEEHVSDDFDERILKVIETKDKEVSHTSVKAVPLRASYGIRPFFKAAAVVAVVLSISMAVQQAIDDQSQTSNVVTLPPAVVPAAPETAFDGNEAKPVVDSLKVNDADYTIQNQQRSE